jgi:hypothetical protein
MEALSAVAATGYRAPWSAGNWFSVDNVRDFAAFLRDCGGFEIW